MKEVRFHGRGGQGTVAAATLLGAAFALYEGRYATSFASFGAERRGAPVTSFVRVSDRPISVRSEVYTPDVVVVLDDSLIETVAVAEGLRDGGLVVVNSLRDFVEIGLALPAGATGFSVDATGVALKSLGANFPSAAMLGALAAVWDEVSLSSVCSAIERGIGHRPKENVAVARETFQSLRKRLEGAKGGSQVEEPHDAGDQ